jgi:hypothetical protein
VFHAGPSSGMNWITNLGGGGTIAPAGTRGGTAMNGNAVMYAAGKILCVGGSSSYSLVRFTLQVGRSLLAWCWQPVQYKNLYARARGLFLKMHAGHDSKDRRRGHHSGGSGLQPHCEVGACS